MRKNSVLLIGVILCAQRVMAQIPVPPAAGDGSQANPYQVATLGNLYWIASDSANLKYYYKQTADINASETSSWFGGQGWKPIGNAYRSSFSGSFDGEGHLIDSLFINRPTELGVGLFGFGGAIKSLGVTHVNITGGDQVGGLLGFNGGYVQNCFSSGYIYVVRSSEGIGGLVGINQGVIASSYSTAIVHRGYASGGLAGACISGTIVNCYSLGPVDGGNAGGLVGTCWYSLVMNSYAAGQVKGLASVGGLIGMEVSSSVYDCYWDIDSSGQTTSAGGAGKTATQLKNPSLFVNSPWDSTIWLMDAGINNGHPYLSWQNPGGTPLPGGHVIAPSAGDGSPSNPYRMATLENLYWLAKNPLRWRGVYCIQVADINASRTRGYGDGGGWIPIGVSTDFGFHGVYDGNGHTIDSLYINRSDTDCKGLFGYSSSGEFDSLGITNEDVTGANGVGGVVGVLIDGLIRNCYSTGNVKGTGSDVGGIVGYAAWSFASNCYSTGRVEGTATNIGGLVGQLATSSQLSNCYSRASVYGVDDVGGLSGFVHNTSSINRCYSVGAVAGIGSVGGLVGGTNGSANITSSFWNTETSGRDSSIGGTGKATQEMKTPATFSQAGWSSALWFMDSTFNDGYPYLSRQNPKGTPLPPLAWMSMSVTNINFGSVPLRSSKEDSVLITNPGTDTLRITTITSTNKSFVFAPSTLKLAPSSDAYLLVTFTPHDTSGQTTFIILTTNTSSSPDTLTASGNGVTTTAVTDGVSVPAVFAISQNYPNPFNPTTLVDYSIPQTTFVLIMVYDVLGREVARLANEVKRPGKYSVKYDGTNVPSGIYFYSIQAGNFHQVRKMLLIK
jgi:hypothetical protein